MKMKKVLAAVLAGTMVLSLAACSKGGDSGEAPEKGGEGGKGEKYTIVYLTPSTASQFWTYVGIGIENAMKDMEEEHGVTIDFSTVGPAEESQTEEYVTAFEQCIAKQPDAIVTATLAIDAKMCIRDSPNAACDQAVCRGK